MSANPHHRVAVLTPPGAGAIGLIRISGDDPATLANDLFRPRNGPPLSHDPPNRLRYGLFVDAEETLDDVVVVAHTVNGRHCVDITAHGGVRVVERIVSALCGRGASWCQADDGQDWAWPAAHCLDSEILRAMTDARSERALRFLAYQREKLPALLHLMAKAMADDARSARAQLENLVSGFRAANALLRGVSVALVGPPNSGKSTLFNRLLGRTAAVVSNTAGTTRDWIAEPILLHGVPVTLVDTAGDHEGGTSLEAEAIEAGRAMAERADLRVLVLDGSRKYGDERHLREQFRAELVVHNKSDLQVHAAENTGIHVAAATGMGVEVLIRRILDRFGVGPTDEFAPTLFTQAQFDWIQAALSALAVDRRAAANCIQARLTTR